MKRGFLSVLGAIALLSPGACKMVADGLTPLALRTEHRTDPLGIDVARPRLSWKVESAERGQGQTAYRVLVASDPAVLAEDRGDLWDSGRVASDATTNIVYEGQPLSSHARAYWKVQVWDREGKPEPWSPPASWTLSLRCGW